MATDIMGGVAQGTRSESGGPVFSWSGGAVERNTAADKGKPRSTARFWRCASGFWRAGGATTAWLLSAGLIGCVVLQLLLQYRLNYWSRDFFNAFERRDAVALQTDSLLFLLLAGLSILVAVLNVMARMTLQRRWRAWLTRHLIDRWLSSAHFRRLSFPKGEDHNPEFRIAEDVRIATDAPVGMGASLLAAILSACTFIGILWNVGGDLVVDAFGREITVPKYLVITVVVYSAMLTLGMAAIGRRLSRVIAGKNGAEAEFRSVGANLRESDNIAPQARQETLAHRDLEDAFDVVVRRWQELCLQMMRTTLVSHGNTLAAPIVAWVLCAPKYLAGSMSLGEVAQAVAAFVVVQAALNWLVDNYPGLAECLSSVKRVASLLWVLDERESRLRPEPASVESTGEPEKLS
jgi:putative ATP-binding cassette transporter